MRFPSHRRSTLLLIMHTSLTLEAATSLTLAGKARQRTPHNARLQITHQNRPAKGLALRVLSIWRHLKAANAGHSHALSARHLI